MRSIDEACVQGARLKACCGEIDLSVRTVLRWRASKTGDDMRMGPKTVPANALSEAEQQEVLQVINSEEFRELSPKQIVAILADRGVYLTSESTMERLLHREGQCKHRGSKRCRSVTNDKRQDSCRLFLNHFLCFRPSSVSLLGLR